MQNKLYTIQFFTLPDDRLHSQSLSSNCWAHGFPRAHKFREFRRTQEFCRTCRTHGKRLNSWKKSELTEKTELTEKESSCPPANPHL